MKKAAVIGHFGNGLQSLDGQTIKTKIVTEELCRVYGEENILRLDTHGGIKALLKAVPYMLHSLKSAKNVMILPAQNGLKMFGRLLPLFRKFYPGRKLHYIVIGGWLPRMLESNKGLAGALKRFDHIYAETQTVKRALEEKGFDNVSVMPNCKELTPLSPEALVYPEGAPYRLCTFSRVMEEKGIADAVQAVAAANAYLGETRYTLDIYGQVDSAQTQWFEALKKDFPDCVRYGGTVPFDRSVEVLKGYFALLFPTRFFTEGIPGTIIDAYAAGIPVISARWQSYYDIVDENITGLGYEICKTQELTQRLVDIQGDIDSFLALKKNCLEKSKCFLPGQAIRVILEALA